MGSIFARQIATAQRLIAKSGQQRIWRQPAKTIGDQTKPWLQTQGAPLDFQVKLVFFPQTRIGHELIRLISGTEVSGGEVQAYMAFTPGLIPTIDDILLASVPMQVQSDAELRIFSIDPLAPNGDVILYDVKFA